MTYFIIAAALILISLVATFAVGFSKTNQSEGDQYTKNSRSKLLKMTYYNVIFSIVLVALLLIYLVQ